MASQFEKFSERARRVLTIAQKEAKYFNHNYVGTEHLLLALLKENEGVAAHNHGNRGFERRSGELLGEGVRNLVRSAEVREEPVGG